MACRKLKRTIARLRNQPRPPPDSFPEPQEDHPSPTPPHEPSPCPNNPADGNDSKVSFDEENPHYKRVDSSTLKEYWQYSVYSTVPIQSIHWSRVTGGLKFCNEQARGMSASS